MAFTFAKQYDFVAGDLRFIGGTFTNAGGSTGGELYTGLQKTEGLLTQYGGSAAVATMPAVDETFPKADPITIVTAADKSGWWLAFGY